MASYKKTSNIFKDKFSAGQYALPTCAKPSFIKIFNVAMPTDHDPCFDSGIVAAPPADSWNIITYLDEDVVTITAGDQVIQL